MISDKITYFVSTSVEILPKSAILSIMFKEKDDKPEQILLAALTVFAQYGYKQTTMDRIAEETELSRSALYLYFKSKKDIFRQLVKTLLDRAHQEAATAQDIDAPLKERLYATFVRREAVFGFLDQSVHGTELTEAGMKVTADITRAAEEKFTGLLIALFEEAEAQGEISPQQRGISTAVCAELLAQSYLGLKLDATSHRQATEKLETLIDIFVAGLAPVNR